MVCEQLVYLIPHTERHLFFCSKLIKSYFVIFQIWNMIQVYPVIHTLQIEMPSWTWGL